jgi:hypothetical protein
MEAEILITKVVSDFRREWQEFVYSPAETEE